MNSQAPYFSVILPVYNREGKIALAIESVLNQTFENWELIVIDDESSDTTFEVIDSFIDSRIKVLRNLKNLGPARSRNRGISMAKGVVITFLDSDDRYFPEFLQKTFFVHKTDQPSLGFCWTGLEVKYNSGIKTELWKPQIIVSPYFSFLKELRIGTNSGLSVKKEVFEVCGMFNAELTAAEDTDFLLRGVQFFDFGFIEDVLISIDKSGKDRLSLDYKKNAESYNRFIYQHWTMINSYPELQQKYFYKLMWLNFHLGDYTLARNYFSLYWKNFGFSRKVFLVRMLFEILGKKIGAKAHVLLSS